MNRLFCFGLGYCAEALAARLRPKGWRIAGTARTRERVFRLTPSGIIAMLMSFSGTARDVALTCHAHPSLSEALREAALDVHKEAIHA